MIIASIDIGTNTILLLVAEVDTVTGNIIPLENIYRLPRIGKGLKAGSPISPDKIEWLLKILTDYKNTAEKYKSDKIIATATNALRIASNSDEILLKVKKETGIEIEIIKGEDEALYSFLGASGGPLNPNRTLIIDIGGGSTEIVLGAGDKIIYKKSFPTGAVSATEAFLKHAPPLDSEFNDLENHLDAVFAELKTEEFNVEKAVAIAGTPTTLAAIKMDLKKFDEEIIEGSNITASELNELTEMLKSLTPEEILNNFKEVVKGREDILLSGSYILKYLLTLLNLDKVIVSTKGIRYGAIVNYLNKSF